MIFLHFFRTTGFCVKYRELIEESRFQKKKKEKKEESHVFLGLWCFSAWKISVKEFTIETG